MKAEAHKEALERARTAAAAMRHCRLCPRNCGVDRTKRELGYCRVGNTPRCFREMIYDGEEDGLNPSHHVYFAGCNLRCEFCTVFEWNENPQAAPKADLRQLWRKINLRRKQGARTLNLVGGEPAVSIAGILELLSQLESAVTVVWNSNMYYSPLVDELLAGMVDIYLADLKVGSARCADRMLSASDYLGAVRRNILSAGRRGQVIIRHVVLPGHEKCCLLPTLRWIAANIPQAQLSLKGDYFPPAAPEAAPAAYLSRGEFQNALDIATRLGLRMVK